MDRLGRWRITKPVAWFLLLLMPLGAAFSIYLFLTELGILLSPAGAAAASYVRTLSPLGNLALPGLNPYLPIVYGWIAIYVGLVVHEGAHGVIARSLGIRVKSSGLVFVLFFPIAAFVDVDEKSLATARALDSERVLGGGAGINIVVAIVSLVLLLSLVATATPAVSGIGVTSVYSNSPAANAGIRPGDYITAVNGVHISDPQVIANSSWYKPGSVINLTTWRDGNYLQLQDVRLTNITLKNTQTNMTFQRAFLGVNDISNTDLQATATTYANSLLKTPLLYVACIPTFPMCQDKVPFSDSMAPFYTSAVGSLFPVFANLLYFMFFLNFNLGIFNALPIYPLDGGRAFQVLVKAIGRGKLSDETSFRITVAVTLALAATIVTAILSPYFL